MQTSFFRSVDDLLRNSKQINMNTAIAARMLPAGPRHRKRELCYAICFMRNLAIFEHSQVLGRPLTDLTEQQIQDEYNKGHKNKVASLPQSAPGETISCLYRSIL